PAPTPLPSASPTPLPSPTAKASKQSATPAAFRAAAAKLGHPAFVAKVRKPKAHRNAVAPAAGWQATYASLRHLASPSAVAVSDGSQSDAAQPSPRTTEEATAAPTERPLPSAAQKVNHSPKIAPSPAAVALAPAAPVDDGPIYAPEKIVAPRFLFADQPDFPEMLRNQGVHASSIVLATVGPNGNLISARIGTSSGYSALDRAALAAARASRYAPPTIDGRAATETYRISYDFSP
ncbi:MAG: TonB family protein, partial [Vulcanimicrobiaceae bacterium]